MNSRRLSPRLFPALFLAFAAACTAAAAKSDLERVTPVPADQPIPTQDFFRPLALSQPTINRAGTHIAAVISDDEDKHLLMVYDIAKNSAEAVGGSGDKDIYNVYWLTDTRVLFQLSTLKLFGLGLMAGNIGDLRHAYPLQQYSASQLVSIPLKSPKYPLVWNRHDINTRRDAGVAVLDSGVSTGAIINLNSALDGYAYMQAFDKVRVNNDKCILKNHPMPKTDGVTYRYMADKFGELAYSFTSDRGVLSMHRLENREWVICPVDLDHIGIIGNANDPAQLLVKGPAIGGKPQPLQFLDAASGKLGDVVLEDPLYDFNGSIYHNRATGDVLGVVFEKNFPRIFWFNEEYTALQKILEGMFPNLIVRIYGNDDHHKIFLVATYSDRQPVVYHWVNLETRKAGVFQKSAPWIDPQRMQPMQVRSFTTRDGYKLDSYLTLPAGATKENPPPLVVLCHGGPFARDTWGFNGEVQFLTHHGYAVLQPNYRGSTGSVGRFPENDEYDYVKMHNDVTDAVKVVLKSGLIDKNRVGIMGASFGGYLAVSGVAHEADLYRCAVTNAGVFDWAEMVQAEKYDQFDLPYYGRMIKTLGDPKVEVAKYAAMSPINFVQNIRVPVFVAGGKEDMTVEIKQSRKLVGELEKNHVTYEKLFIGGEAHGMAFLKNEVELYDRVIIFLDKYLKSAKPGS